MTLKQMKMPGPGLTINASPKNDYPLQELAPHCPLQKVLDSKSF
jgi:hypothetical protein